MIIIFVSLNLFSLCYLIIKAKKIDTIVLADKQETDKNRGRHPMEIHRERRKVVMTSFFLTLGIRRLLNGEEERETCMPINKRTRKEISCDIFIMQVQIWRHSRLTGGENRINNNNKRRTMSRNNSSRSRINNSIYLYHRAHHFARCR